MRISLQQALQWTACSQHLDIHSQTAITEEPGLTLPALVEAVGGITGQPNHAPFLSLLAREPRLTQVELIKAQSGGQPLLARSAGPPGGFLLTPQEMLPSMALLAVATGQEESRRLIEPLKADEVRTAVRWISDRLQVGPCTYPELRQGANPGLLRHVERGTERALHQETALQQVLLALEYRGDVVSTMAGGLNTSEGPYRYHLRSRVTSETYGPEEAHTRLAEWYIAAFAPVTARDFEAWSGLPETTCRRAMGRVSVPLRTLNIEGLGEDFLAPASFFDRPASDQPLCRLLPWQDNWLHAYRDMDRSAPEGLREPLTPRDLALVSIGSAASSDTIAARIRVVGSAREPRFQPEPWRQLASHENAALQMAMETLARIFTVQ